MKKAKLKKLLNSALQRLAAQQSGADQASDRRTVGEWLQQFEAILAERPYVEQTRKNHRAAVGHIRRLWGDRALGSLRPHEITTGLRTFLPEHSATARRVLAELRDVYSEAVANGWIDVNPAVPVKAPPHHVIRERLTFAVWQAMRTLAQAGPQRWLESLLLLGVVTGQRRADLDKMRFDDIVTGDDGAKYLRVEQQKKARKPVGARIEIPLSLRLDAIGMTVGDVIEHCRNSAKPGPYLLRKANGGRLEASSLSARFHECIVAVCGPDAYEQYKWPSGHEMRSLAARLYDAEGKDPQTLLGHSHREMTELYLDDRGLSNGVWKRVSVSAEPDHPAMHQVHHRSIPSNCAFTS